MHRLIMNMGKSKQVFEIIIMLTLLGAAILSWNSLRRLEEE